MLNDVAQCHRPVYPAVRHASIQIRAVSREPRGFLFRYAAKLTPNRRNVRLPRRTVFINHRLVVSTVHRKPSRLADRRRQVRKQTMKAFRHSADVTRRQLTRNCPASKLVLPRPVETVLLCPLAPVPPPLASRQSPQLAAHHDTSAFQPRLGRHRRPSPQAATGGRSIHA